MTEPGSVVIDQEEDAPQIAKVSLVALGCLAVCAGAVLWVIGILRGAPRPSDLRGTTIPLPLGQPEIGMVYQAPFEHTATITEGRARQRETLSTYGWVDRHARIIHIPIDEAMRRLSRMETRP